MNIYQQQILDLFRHPRHKSVIENPDITGESRNLSCGDEVKLMLLTEADTVTSATFTGEGCVISQAAAELVCRKIIGKSVTEALAYNFENLQQEMQIELSPQRIKCAKLVIDALQNHHPVNAE